MKVSVILPIFGDRNQFQQAQNGILCLSKQTYKDFEVLVVDDGAYFELSYPDSRFIHIDLRHPGSDVRSSNIAFLEGFNHATGDFIITSHPEILVQSNAIETMIDNAFMERRNIPIQYHLSLEHIQSKKFKEILIGDDFTEFKQLPNFWTTKTPWNYLNDYASSQHMHFSFCGQSRDGWLKYGEFLPRTESWYQEDCWWHDKEREQKHFPNPLDLEIYHQWHPRCYGNVEDETKASIRIRRIRGLA